MTVSAIRKKELANIIITTFGEPLKELLENCDEGRVARLGDEEYSKLISAVEPLHKGTDQLTDSGLMTFVGMYNVLDASRKNKEESFEDIPVLDLNVLKQALEMKSPVRKRSR